MLGGWGGGGIAEAAVLQGAGHHSIPIASGCAGGSGQQGRTAAKRHGGGGVHSGGFSNVGVHECLNHCSVAPLLKLLWHGITDAPAVLGSSRTTAHPSARCSRVRGGTVRCCAGCGGRARGGGGSGGCAHPPLPPGTLPPAAPRSGSGREGYERVPKAPRRVPGTAAGLSPGPRLLKVVAAAFRCQ